MLSPVRPEYIRIRRMSPAPFINPNAFDIVGAATTIVAANTPNRPRRVIPAEVKFAILCACPVAALRPPVSTACLSLHPQVPRIIRTPDREAQAKIARHSPTLGAVGKKLLKSGLPSAENRTVARV